jgi:serine/threonine-protein kinase
VNKLGKYELLSILGSGATAEVYSARDTVLGREVALKILRPALVADPSAFERFVHEAQAAAGLFHPNIATVLDMGEADGRYFIAMRYIPGESLDKVLKEKGSLSWEATIHLAEQIGAALDCAHEQGFLHRDVKPSNIICTPKGDFVLTDFGLQRAMMSTGLTSHTGVVLGTPAYIAPEVWDGKPAVPATDQYALACVVVEAVTGKVLFDGNTPMAVMKRHSQGWVPPVKWPKGLPEGFESILQKALAKESKDRYPDLPHFAEALESLERKTQQSQKAVDRAKQEEQRMQQELKITEQHRLDAEVKANKNKRQKTSTSPVLQKEAVTHTTLGSWLGGGTAGLAGIVVIILIAILGLWVSLNLGSNKPKVNYMPTMSPVPTQNQISTEMPTETQTPMEFLTYTYLPTFTSTSAVGLGTHWKRPVDGMTMVYVPNGIFSMGSNSFINAQPEHTVYLDAFWIDLTEVTNAMYAKCASAGVCQTPSSNSSNTRSTYYSNSEYANYPVINVTWYNAQAFCTWVNSRLPTEAEWEKAARGTDGQTFPWGNNLPTSSLANFSPGVVIDTATVGSYPSGASPYGALDLAGNVWEWVNDWYGETYYIQSPSNNPQGPDSGIFRVLRGGSWSVSEGGILSANRFWASPGRTLDEVGFRCSR